MILYHRWKCPWCAAARQGIENVEADVELVEVPRARDERTQVIEASGQARVPVLVDGDEVVVGSQRVVYYLYSHYGDESFSRSISELETDMAEDDEPEAFEVPESPTA